MASVADAPLADLCREAGPATVTDFVAALYEARGWTADRHSDRQLVVSDGDRDRRLAVVHPDDGVPASDLAAWADTLLVVDGAAAVTGDVAVLDTASLRDQLAYAVDRPVAGRLLETHFGWTPSADTGPTPPGPSGESDPPLDGDGDTSGRASTRGGRRRADIAASLRRVWRPSAGRSRVLVAAVLVLAVVGVTAVGLADIVGDGPPAVDDSDGSRATVTATPQPVAETESDDASVEEPPTPSAEETGGAGASVTQIETLPPGIDRSGAIVSRTLSEAHERSLTNRSYTVSLTYREFVDGLPSGVYTETVRVENATRYSADVTTRGELRTTPFTLAETDVYANGSVRFERTGEASVERAVLLNYDRFLDDYSLYLLWFLDVRESTIVDSRTDRGSTTLYVVTDENPDPSVKNTTGSIVVTEAGRVRSARWSYDVSGTPSGYGNLSVTFELQVSDVGETTVREPGWLNASRD